MDLNEHAGKEATMSTKKFDVTIVLNLYSPYVSGLTETARLVAEGMVRRGKKIAVVSTQHDRDLPREEKINGVKVFRAPIAFRIGRGPVSFSFLPLVKRIARISKFLNLHLPMLEAAAIASLIPNTTLVSTYHIDLWLAPSILNRLQIASVNLSARHALRRSAHIIVNSDDQAKYSLMWPTIRGKSWSSIPAPCLDARGGSPIFRDGAGYHVGFMGRIVPDKGIEFLIHAFKSMAAKEDRLLLAGDYETVAGGSNIIELRRLAGDDTRIRFLGLLDRAGTRDFYASIDTFALPSIAESFGIAQAEAMMCGLPVVGSNLPGGRVPIRQTGFGLLTEPGDVQAIASALINLKDTPAERRHMSAEFARKLYGLEACIDRYETLFDGLSQKNESTWNFK